MLHDDLSCEVLLYRMVIDLILLAWYQFLSLVDTIELLMIMIRNVKNANDQIQKSHHHEFLKYVTSDFDTSLNVGKRRKSMHLCIDLIENALDVLFLKQMQFFKSFTQT